ncbi:hypothetical protein [Saccharococcus caldoxylosilyticus]|uniref:Uncharacterized protein n=1 Tax=Parageobacillus caldoxylosilyticus NBRC 107762 TaxID=1220594 RepID=A0A023DGQ8_9BACL|nr:hypothetical protein [Parageobacillus caldoxylosilyticus]MBB3853665.1 hypothetical protein [Parageobacillus caldoxylosilyticus]BDG35741.1 hypothetical protein PcaKH15_16470 [Parageobacillus caldoxylosilyticus]BDG39522.1 hypothetical protein PcaKH16_16610 [Parageobacillus caldoxylosilyticus]GAJ40460.1 hypothetical protein GCA01S_044_00470 [Parageobacillus caldoxylosilyticus NBRC 107762]
MGLLHLFRALFYHFYPDFCENYITFIDESVIYEEDVKREYNHYYVTGYLCTGDGHRYWKYAPYNGVENEKTIEEVFSRVFKTIEEVKSQQMDGNVPAEE